MSSQRPTHRQDFDFRLAMSERERAIRRLERLVQRSTDTGEPPDAIEIAGLISVITGRIDDGPDVAIDLRNLPG